MVTIKYSDMDTTTDIQQTKTHITRFLLAGIVVICIGILALFFLRDSDDARETGLDTVSSEQREYEVVPVPDPFPNDLDRDGIDDEVEVQLGLAEENPDTDADGLNDYDEIDMWKTDPLKFDTDGDGYGDGWEVLSGYNPNGLGTLSDVSINQ